MEELVDSGLAKNIGVSNVNGALLNDILSYAKYDPQVNQVEIHPYLTQEALIQLCKYHGVAITAYCSFGPASWAELNMHGHVESLFEHGTIKAVAQETGRSACFLTFFASLLMSTMNSRGASPPSLGPTARTRRHSQV